MGYLLDHALSSFLAKPCLFVLLKACVDCACLLSVMPLWSLMFATIYSGCLQKSTCCSFWLPLNASACLLLRGSWKQLSSSLALSPYPDSHNLAWLLGMRLLYSTANAALSGSASTHCLCAWSLVIPQVPASCPSPQKGSL